MADSALSIAKQNLSKYDTSGTLDNNASTSSSSRTQLSQNYTTFLKMLTTQLQNQDPLSPMDSAQFTQQLVQYSSVEQAISTNEKLDKIIAANQSNSIGSTLGYIGKEVEAASNALPLSGGRAEFTYNLSDSVTSNVILISDSTGKVVRQMTGALSTGKRTVVWDGKDDNGQQRPDGNYTVNVVGTKSDSSVAKSNVTTFGLVSGAETVGNENKLNVGDQKISVGNIISIRTPKTGAT